MDRGLPFELRALEAALAHTTRALELESIQVERTTLPSLKALLNKVALHCGPAPAALLHAPVSDVPPEQAKVSIQPARIGIVRAWSWLARHTDPAKRM